MNFNIAADIYVTRTILDEIAYILSDESGASMLLIHYSDIEQIENELEDLEDASDRLLQLSNAVDVCKAVLKIANQAAAAGANYIIFHEAMYEEPDISTRTIYESDRENSTNPESRIYISTGLVDEYPATQSVTIKDLRESEDDPDISYRVSFERDPLSGIESPHEWVIRRYKNENDNVGQLAATTGRAS